MTGEDVEEEVEAEVVDADEDGGEEAEEQTAELMVAEDMEPATIAMVEAVDTMVGKSIARNADCDWNQLTTLKTPIRMPNRLSRCGTRHAIPEDSKARARCRSEICG